MAKLAGLMALFAAGVLLASGVTAVGAADVTTTETVSATTTIEETTTAPASTVETTVEQTTTVAPTTTAESSGSSSSTPTWVWIVLGILAAGVIGLLVALFTRGGGISAEERQRRLDAAVATWTAQGWALESQTPGSTILRRGPELMVVSIDDHGQISTRPVAGP